MNPQKTVDDNADSWYNKSYMNANGLDELDLQIIAALKEDGRMSFAELARRFDVSAGTARERYHRLVDNGVLQVVAVTNPPKIGYQMMTLIGIKADGSRLREIAREIAALEEVVYVVLCTGSFDLLAEVICRDSADLATFLTEHLHTVEGIRDTQTFVYLDIVKEIYT
jgi:Lrp/AsnC family transcriptional regulator for asnA, asnC and gidA